MPNGETLKPEVEEGRERKELEKKEYDLLPFEMKRLIESLSPEVPSVFKEQSKEAAVHINRLVDRPWIEELDKKEDTKEFIKKFFSRAGFLPINFLENHTYFKYKNLRKSHKKMLEEIRDPSFTSKSQDIQRHLLDLKRYYELQIASLGDWGKVHDDTPDFIYVVDGKLAPQEKPKVTKGREFSIQYFSLGKELGIEPAKMTDGWYHGASLGDRIEECKLYIHGENMDKAADASLKKVFQYSKEEFLGGLSGCVWGSKIAAGYYLVLYCQDKVRAKGAIKALSKYGISVRGPAQDEIYIILKKDGGYKAEPIDSNDSLLGMEVKEDESSKENLTLPKVSEFPKAAAYKVEFLRRWLIYCFKLNRAPNNPYMRAFTRVVLEEGLSKDSPLVRDKLKGLDVRGVPYFIDNNVKLNLKSPF